MKKGFMRIILFALLVLCGFGGNVCHVNAEKNISVNYRTQDQIRAYFKKNKVNRNFKTSFSVPASTKKPYNMGKISDSSLSELLNVVNAYRYVIGVDKIKYGGEWTKTAQAAALLWAVNGPNATQYVQPEGMSDELYKLGSEGMKYCMRAFTSRRYGLAEYLDYWIDQGFMYTKFFSPYGKELGIGLVDDGRYTYCAVRSRGDGTTNGKYEGVVWPAQNMPVEFFADSEEWMIEELEREDIPTGMFAEVTLTRLNDNRTWHISANSKDGSISGGTGSVRFTPYNIHYSAGDQFLVEVKEAGETITYTVSFFSINADPDTCVHTYGKQMVLEKASVKSDGKKIRACSKCGQIEETTIYKASKVSLSKASVTYTGKVQKPVLVVKNSKGKVIASENYKVTVTGTPKKGGIYPVTVAFQGEYTGTKKLLYTINPKSVAIKAIKPSKQSLWITTQKGVDITGYEICYSTSKDFGKLDTKTVTVPNRNKTRTKLSELSRNQTYFVRVRTYKTVSFNGKKQTIYSQWSKTKAVKTL